MKLKALLCAGLMLATSIIIPSEVYAETTYASASALITDAIEVAVTGVTSTTYDTAISNMQGKITMSGDMVSYDGTPIGYWYSDDSDTIWSDSGRTSTVLTPTDGDVWEFDPDILSSILTDFNNDLIENVVPTTEDWSKIVGKYDVTLGDITFPANNWVPLSPSESPLSDGTTFNVSTAIGKTNLEVTAGARVTLCFYLIGNDGSLYIQDLYLSYNNNNGNVGIYHGSISTDEIGQTIQDSRGFGIPNTTVSTYVYTKVGLYALSGDLCPALYITNISNSSVGMTPYHSATRWPINFLSIKDPSQVWDNTSGYKEVGVFFIDQEVVFGTSYRDESFKSHLTDIFMQTPSSSKKQIGNTLLKQRLSKFSALTVDDTVEVASTGWTVIGLGGEEKNFDTYLGTQGILNAGDTADIAAVADAEALAFYVVAPTSLPVYMDSKGVISVATNASIENKSAASVTLTDVQIEPKADSGWTMVQTTPSRKRDANEFTFSTSLVADTAIDTGAEHPFTYDVDLSPTTEGFESLDLASVLVTVDWTEVT